jgi:hypothetical protein
MKGQLLFRNGWSKGELSSQTVRKNNKEGVDEPYSVHKVHRRTLKNESSSIAQFSLSFIGTKNIWSLALFLS